MQLTGQRRIEGRRLSQARTAVSRHWRRLGSALIAAALGGSGSVAHADDWGTPGLDMAHRRLSAERSGALFGGMRWATHLKGGGAVLASPVVADGFLVTVDIDGVMTALRADDGSPAWQVATGSAVHGTPAVAQGRIFVPTFGNQVVALRLADGRVLWTRDVGGAVLSSPTPVDGDIVVAAGLPQHHVLRLSGQTGEVVWQSADVMQQFSNTSPAVGGGLVVVGANGGHYYAFDAATGAARWQYTGDGLVHLAAPIIVGGRVFMAGGYDSDHVHAVDLATGASVAGWPIDLPSPAPDVPGTLLGRHRALSSFASVGGLLLLQTRLDDALDTDGDSITDQRLSREIVVAIDSTTGELAWQLSRGRAKVADPNSVPKFLVCPTPAAYATDSGSPLLAVASSLDATIVVLDPASGNELARMQVAGPALASPVMANGRLYAAAAMGTIEGLTSRVNAAPFAPIPAASIRPVDAAELTLRWLPAIDPDGDIPSYELRIDSDGEVLESWQQQILLAPGTTSVPITGTLAAGTTYTFALRARDTHGAMSPWSTPQTFTVFNNPKVAVGAVPGKSLTGALASASPGDIIMLSAGTYTLVDTLQVGAGVSIQGAGAGRTTLDATSVAVGVTLNGNAPGHPTVVDGLTVAGADTCVQVGEGNVAARLAHVIVRDCKTDGIAIAVSGSAAIANTTLVGNGTAVHAKGATTPTTVKNSILTDNTVGLAADLAGGLVSSYDGLFSNGTGYKGLSAGNGDLSATVTFADLVVRDLRLLAPQPSTDRGDPADDVAAEPVPNGARINLGAFGGTNDAETSAPSAAIDGGSTGPDADHSGTSPRTPPDEAGGGNGCVVSGGDPDGLAALLLDLLALLTLRRSGPAKPSGRSRERRSDRRR